MQPPEAPPHSPLVSKRTSNRWKDASRSAVAWQSFQGTKDMFVDDAVPKVAAVQSVGGRSSNVEGGSTTTATVRGIGASVSSPRAATSTKVVTNKGSEEGASVAVSSSEGEGGAFPELTGLMRRRQSSKRISFADLGQTFVINASQHRGQSMTSDAPGGGSSSNLHASPLELAGEHLRVCIRESFALYVLRLTSAASGRDTTLGSGGGGGIKNNNSVDPFRKGQQGPSTSTPCVTALSLPSSDVMMEPPAAGQSSNQKRLFTNCVITRPADVEYVIERDYSQTLQLSEGVFPGAFEWNAIYLRVRPSHVSDAEEELKETAVDLVRTHAMLLLNKMFEPLVATAQVGSARDCVHCVVGCGGGVDSKVLLTVWRWRKAGKLFHRSLAAVNHGLRCCMLPAIFRGMLNVCVAHHGFLFTATWLPPLSSDVPLPAKDAPMLTAAVSLLSVFLLREERLSQCVDVFPCPDGTYLCVPGSSVVSEVQKDRSGMHFAELLFSHCLPAHGTGQQRLILSIRRCAFNGVDHLDRRTFLRDLFHACGCRMRSLLEIRALLLQQLEDDALIFSSDPDVQRRATDTVIAMASMMVTEAVARTLKSITLSKCLASPSSTPNASSLPSVEETSIKPPVVFQPRQPETSDKELGHPRRFTRPSVAGGGSEDFLVAVEESNSLLTTSVLGSTTSSVSRMQALCLTATTIVKRFVTSGKFIREMLVPSLGKKFPCGTVDMVVDPKMVSTVDIVEFLKHRLGIDFDNKAKAFVLVNTEASNPANANQTATSSGDGGSRRQSVSSSSVGNGKKRVDGGSGSNNSSRRSPTVQGVSFKSLPGSLTNGDAVQYADALSLYVRQQTNLHPAVVSCGLHVAAYYGHVAVYLRLRGGIPSCVSATEMHSMKLRAMNAISIAVMRVLNETSLRYVERNSTSRSMGSILEKQQKQQPPAGSPFTPSHGGNVGGASSLVGSPTSPAGGSFLADEKYFLPFIPSSVLLGDEERSSSSPAAGSPSFASPTTTARKSKRNHATTLIEPATGVGRTYVPEPMGDHLWILTLLEGYRSDLAKALSTSPKGRHAGAGGGGGGLTASIAARKLLHWASILVSSTMQGMPYGDAVVDVIQPDHMLSISSGSCSSSIDLAYRKQTCQPTEAGYQSLVMLILSMRLIVAKEMEASPVPLGRLHGEYVLLGAATIAVSSLLPPRLLFLARSNAAVQQQGSGSPLNPLSSVPSSAHIWESGLSDSLEVVVDLLCIHGILGTATPVPLHDGEVVGYSSVSPQVRDCVIDLALRLADDDPRGWLLLLLVCPNIDLLWMRPCCRNALGHAVHTTLRPLGSDTVTSSNPKVKTAVFDLLKGSPSLLQHIPRMEEACQVSSLSGNKTRAEEKPFSATMTMTATDADGVNAETDLSRVMQRLQIAARRVGRNDDLMDEEEMEDPEYAAAKWLMRVLDEPVLCTVCFPQSRTIAFRRPKKDIGSKGLQRGGSNKSSSSGAALTSTAASGTTPRGKSTGVTSGGSPHDMKKPQQASSTSVTRFLPPTESNAEWIVLDKLDVKRIVHVGPSFLQNEAAKRMQLRDAEQSDWFSLLMEHNLSVRSALLGAPAPRRKAREDHPLLFDAGTSRLFTNERNLRGDIELKEQEEYELIHHMYAVAWDQVTYCWHRRLMLAATEARCRQEIMQNEVQQLLLSIQLPLELLQREMDENNNHQWWRRKGNTRRNGAFQVYADQIFREEELARLSVAEDEAQQCTDLRMECALLDSLLAIGGSHSRRGGSGV